METLKDILAVIVLYNCQIEESAAFCSLNESLRNSRNNLDILVYDNSPHPSYSERIFTKGNLNITYISDIHNPGVSKAYNTGIDLAKELGKKWLLLTDQDTHYPLDAIKAYVRQIEKGQLLSAPLLTSGVLTLSPCGYKWGRGWPLKRTQAGETTLHAKSVLNSGLLIHLSVFKKAGKYNVNIPLDFSDHEWLERVKRHYPTIDIMPLNCHHPLSAKETDIKKVLARFKYYLAGAKEYQKNNRSLGLRLTILLRTTKLSLRFRTLDFLRYYLQS